MRGAAAIETTVGSTREPRYVAEAALCDRIISLLKHKHRHAQEAKLAGALRQSIDTLFEAVADKDNAAQWALSIFIERMLKHAGNLRHACLAAQSLHCRQELCGITVPGASVKLTKAAEVAELHCEPA